MLRRSIALLTLAAAAMQSACGPAQVSNPAPPPDGAFDLGHTALESILQRHVDERGLVDYEALTRDRAPLDTHLASVAAVDRATFESWARSDQLAFLINAYNAYTLQLVVGHWPVESIKETHIARNPWDHFEFPLLGESVTLNQIEHDLIRGEFEEPRIHFALVCAAVSCPPLQRSAYVGDGLEVALGRVTDEFLRGPENDLSDPQRIVVSPLFDWYAEDFVEAAGSVQTFVSSHSGQAVSPEAEVDFAPYDWAINSQ